MRFKHTFHVFVDNFSVIYKQLLFRLIITVISGIICGLCISPLLRDLIKSEQFNRLLEGIGGFASNLLNGKIDELSTFSQRVKDAYADVMVLLQAKTASFILSGFIVLLIYLVAKWFEGLCNYATAAVINDRMALRAEQPFLGTLIRNLKEAVIYNSIYIPLSIAYDLIVGVAMFFLLFFLLNNVLYFLISIFLFVLAIVLAIMIKMTFTCDWLPALIRGKKGQLGALKYSFVQKGKKPLGVMSNFTVITIGVFAVNAAAIVLTFGVGLLITIPSSYVIIICFEMVNYYDREELKYFLDKNTIVNTSKEHVVTREEFFRGE